MNKKASFRLFRGRTLPLPDQYEEGDLFFVQDTTELYVRDGGNWVLLSSSGLVTDGANVGVQPGEVFRNKTGTILNFRTIGNTDGSLVVQTIGDEVIINFATTGGSAPVVNAANVGAGTGLVFRNKTGNTLNFRSILNTDGALNVQTVGDEVRIDLATTGPGAPVNNAQNLGGAFEVYKNKTGNTLNFRTLESVSSGNAILKGYGTDTIQFRGIRQLPVGFSLVRGIDANDVLVKGIRNVGPGVPLLRSSIADAVDVKSLVAGYGIYLTDLGDNVVIDASAPASVIAHYWWNWTTGHDVTQDIWVSSGFTAMTTFVTNWYDYRVLLFGAGWLRQGGGPLGRVNEVGVGIRRSGGGDNKFTFGAFGVNSVSAPFNDVSAAMWIGAVAQPAEFLYATGATPTNNNWEWAFWLRGKSWASQPITMHFYIIGIY